MTRTKLFFAFALVFVPLAVLTSAPAPEDKIRLAPAGKVKVDNLVVNDAALINENRVVIVGRTGSIKDAGADIPANNEGVPNGAIIDLAKKSVQHFANQHPAQIWGVSPYGGRIVTVSTGFDGFLRTILRSWDLKTEESKEVVNLGEGASSSQVRCFHKSDRVVVDKVERLFVFSPAKPKERMELACPAGVEFLSGPLAVSPDDAWIACEGEHGQVVCFEVATKKATVVAVTPKDAGEKWFVHRLAFTSSGKLLVCRSGNNGDEVPESKDEKDVPAERRGIVRIDLPEGKVVPLGMGHTSSTYSCAVDGGETWLATVGSSRLDKPKPNDKYAGELRVYNLSSRKLAYREQLKGVVAPQWVWFTPSGKRLVCVTMDGIVRWWDVPVR